VVVRPHPISFRKEPENIRLLEELKFKIDRSDTREMSALYGAADFLLCDYGGTAFSALYLDRNIVQLQVPGADEWYTSAGSSNFHLRSLLDPVVSLNEIERFDTLFDDSALWKRQRKQREIAFAKYFAPYRGKSAKRAAKVLRHIRDIGDSTRLRPARRSPPDRLATNDRRNPNKTGWK
jgi:CDP-glycerol glycerophosphotransferase (TagB/SpsB family)